MPLLTLNAQGAIQSVPEYDAAATRTSPALPPILDLYRLYSANHRHDYDQMPLGPLRRWEKNLWILRVFPSVYGNPWRTSGVAEFRYGNIEEDILEPIVIFSTFEHVIFLTGFAEAASGNWVGNTDGVDLTLPHTPATPPPNPPLPSPLNGSAEGDRLMFVRSQFLMDVAIDADIDFSTVDVEVKTEIFGSSFGSFDFSFFLKGARAVLVQYLPDWKERPPEVRHAYRTDIFNSDWEREQRTSPFMPNDEDDAFDSELIWFLKYRYKVDGLKDSMKLWHRLHRLRHKRAAVPFAVTPYVPGFDLGGVDAFTPVNILPSNSINRLQVGDEIVRFFLDDPDYFEARRVIDLGGNQIVVNLPWGRNANPKLTPIYKVVYVHADGVGGEFNSDTHHEIDVTWRSV